MALEASSPGKQNQLPAFKPPGWGAEPRRQQDGDKRVQPQAESAVRIRLALFLGEKEQRQSPGMTRKELEDRREQRPPSWGFTGTVKGNGPPQSGSAGSRVGTAQD